MGIVGKLWRIIANMHSGMKSCVQIRGHTSSSLDVRQGSRQGGVISHFTYLCYIDKLLHNLVRADVGLQLCVKSVSCPTVADDMVLAPLSKYGLDQMMGEWYNYSCRWRYEYNPSKCAVIVFNESKRRYTQSIRKWKIGPHEVKETDKYTHLGIICDKYMNLTDTVTESSQTNNEEYRSFDTIRICR